MALLHQESFQEIESVDEQIDSLFAPVASNREQVENRVNTPPGITIRQTETEIILSIETGDINVRDLDIKVSEEAVFIKGKRRFEFVDEYRGIFCKESHYCQFQHVIPLPALVQNCDIEVVCTGDALCLKMPRLENVKHRVVSVNLLINN